jgi:hypothetical protein
MKVGENRDFFNFLIKDNLFIAFIHKKLYN